MRPIIAVDWTPELSHLLDYAFDPHFSRRVVLWRSLLRAIVKDQNGDQHKRDHRKNLKHSHGAPPFLSRIELLHPSTFARSSGDRQHWARPMTNDGMGHRPKNVRGQFRGH